MLDCCLLVIVRNNCRPIIMLPVHTFAFCVKRILLALCIIVAVLCLVLNMPFRYLHPEQLLSHSNIFRETISQHERDLFKSLLMTFGDLAEGANVTYFLADGSMIGSVRHHGMIPWDDDLDIGVLRSDEHKLRQMFGRLPANVQYFQSSFRWKMCFKDRPRVTFGHGWTFPTLDIGFYVTSGGQMWDDDQMFKTPKMNLDVVYPLIRRPFMGLMVPAPHLPHKYIEINLKSDVMTLCASSRFSHRQAFFTDPYLRRTIRCAALWSLYPFVNRTIIKDLHGSHLVNETLVFNGKILSSLITKY